VRSITIVALAATVALGYLYVTQRSLILRGRSSNWTEGVDVDVPRAGPPRPTKN
jgi:hypothetical protein